MATTTAVPKNKIFGGSFLLESRQPEEVFTPEDFSEQHQLIGQTAEEFAVNEILPNVEKIEHKDFSVSRDLLKKAGELGLSGVEIPEAYGGLEMDKVTAAIIADHIAKYAGFAGFWRIGCSDDDTTAELLGGNAQRSNRTGRCSVVFRRYLEARWQVE